MDLRDIARRFGTVAVEKGFITLDQLTQALNIQLMENMKDGRHRLIGDILLEKKFINMPQVNEVLRSMGTEPTARRADA